MNSKVVLILGGVAAAAAALMALVGKSTGQAIGNAIANKNAGTSSGGGKSLQPSPGIKVRPGQGAGLPSTFWPALWHFANQIGSDPFAMANVMMSESGLNPKAKNSIGCVGLNQFCGTTFAGVVLGKSASEWNAMSSDDKNAALDDYRSKSAEEQLAFVAKFWASKPAAALKTARDLYWVNFLPATYVAGADDSHVLTTSSSILNANPVFVSHDANGNPQITAGDLQRALDHVALTPEFQTIVGLIAQANPNLGVA